MSTGEWNTGMALPFLSQIGANLADCKEQASSSTMAEQVNDAAEVMETTLPNAPQT